MDPDTGAKGKSRFDLTDVMSMLDIGESAKVDETIEPQESKAPEMKISIVTLPAANEKEALEVVPEPKVPAIKAPEQIKMIQPDKVPEATHVRAKADNALSSKLLADMEQKNAEILKLKSDFMALQYKVNEKDYQLKEKDANLQNISSRLSDAQKKFEAQQRQSGDLQRQLENQQRRYDELQRQLDTKLRLSDDIQRQLEGQRRQSDDLQRQLENQLRKHEDLQKQLESQQKKYDELLGQYDVVKAELDVINEDKAKVMARAQAHKQKKTEGFNAAEDTPAMPEEDDVASIFKRLTQDKPEEQTEGKSGDGQPNVPSMDRPQPPRKPKTAKLYDL